MKCRLAIIALVLPVTAWAKPAVEEAVPAHEGVPALDARDETALVGAGAAKAAPAESQGTWAAHGGEHALDKPDKSGTSWWMAADSQGPLQDGFVRARFAFDTKESAGLVVRAKIERTEKTAYLNGYVIGAAKGKIEFRRQQGGAATTLAGGVAMPCKGLCELEVAVWMIGPHLVAKVYDGDTMKELASMVVSDASMPSGLFGVRVGGNKPALLRALSMRRAGAPLLQRAGALGRHRYLALPSALAHRLEGLQAKVVDRGTGTWIAELSATGREALLRRVPDALEVFVDEPRAYSDSDFRNAQAKPVEATATGFRLDRSYKDAAMTEALLRAYAGRFPASVALLELGRTRQDRPILALRIHSGPKPVDEVPQVLLNGAHHGVELAALEFALDGCAWLIDRQATDPEVQRWTSQLTIWCVPLVNPDGNHLYFHVSKHGGRKNGRDVDGNGRVDPTDGVDLNRNYPYRWHSLGEIASHSDPRRAWYRGPRAASEPETQAMMRLADSVRFVASISYHTNANAILVPYTIPEAPDPVPNEAWNVAKSMADRAGRQVNGRPFTVKRRLYPVDGVDQDWHRAAHGTTALLVEGTLTNPGLDRLHKMVDATRGTWMGLLDRVLAGPGLAGRVVDRQGKPVVAEIKIREIALKDSERWTSRCQDGRFTRLLETPGSYTVDAVGSTGAVLASSTVDVTNGNLTNIELTVDSSSSASSCSRPDLCAIDSACLAERTTCGTTGPARYCRIGGKCIERGVRGEKGICNPDREPWDWTAG